MYTIKLSFSYLNTEAIYMSVPEHKLLCLALLPYRLNSAASVTTDTLKSKGKRNMHVFCG